MSGVSGERCGERNAAGLQPAFCSDPSCWRGGWFGEREVGRGAEGDARAGSCLGVGWPGDTAVKLGWPDSTESQQASVLEPEIAFLKMNTQWHELKKTQPTPRFYFAASD